MNVYELDRHVLEAIMNHQGIEDDTIDVVQTKLQYMSAEEAFEAFLTWHGIIGYDRMIRNALKSIEKACGS